MSALDEFLSLTEAVADAGFGLQTFKDVPTERVYEALHDAGYAEVLTDSGKVMWSKPWWNTSGATSTATAGKTMGQNLVSTITTEAGAGEGLVNITASSVGFTTEASSVAKGASMIATTPKLAIVTAVASACGLAFGFDLGQEIVDLYFGDDDFDWTTDSIGGKIITFISGDKTYVDEDLANRIKDRLIDIGAYESKFNPSEITLGKELNFSGINTNLPDSYSDVVDRYSGGVEFAIASLTSLYGSFSNGDCVAISYYGANHPDFNYASIWVNCYRNIEDNVKITIDSVTKGTLESFNNALITNNGYSEIKTYLHGNIDKPMTYDGVNIVKRKKSDNWSLDSHDSYKLKPGDFGIFYYYEKEYSSSSYSGARFYNMGSVSIGIGGVSKQPDAIYPTRGTPLTTTYPNLRTNGGKVPTKDGEKTVIPLKIPKPNEGTEPQADAQSGKYPRTDPNPYIDDLINVNRLPNNKDNIPTKDNGDTPTPVIPPIGVEAIGFVALYNPTQSQLSSFSQYLWSDNFIDNFKKLFSNPMDAIIGLHMIYATPNTGNEAEIVCGYAHSGVMSKTVSSQYIEIDCGSIKVNRYFGNVLDYAPYTKLQLYLPFVGIVDLDTNEIMDGTLNIIYRIDVLTGSCLARLKITRGDYNAELYNFAGNCAVQLPISGGSYSGIIANAIGVAGSIGATIASDGALAPVLVGSAVSSATNSHTNVSHSGSLGSNSGALGIKKPYLIITRPKPAEADKFNEFYGKPSNKTIRLGSCSGYTRVKDIHVENISSATDDELNEIESLLKEGVII